MSEEMGTNAKVFQRDSVETLILRGIESKAAKAREFILSLSERLGPEATQKYLDEIDQCAKVVKFGPGKYEPGKSPLACARTPEGEDPWCIEIREIVYEERRWGFKKPVRLTLINPDAVTLVVVYEPLAMTLTGFRREDIVREFARQFATKWADLVEGQRNLYGWESRHKRHLMSIVQEWH